MVGEPTEAPALLVEGVYTFDPDRLAGGGSDFRRLREHADPQARRCNYFKCSGTALLAM